MPAETIEQKAEAVNIDEILVNFKKALKKRNPEKALIEVRDAVSKAGYDGRIDSCSLVYLARETQKIMGDYSSGKRKYQK